jgi:hypothetical protein
MISLSASSPAAAGGQIALMNPSGRVSIFINSTRQTGVGFHQGGRFVKNRAVKGVG